MGMVKLQKKYNKRGFNVLAFPCNQFAAQEPNSNAVIEKFAATKSKYGNTCSTGLGCPFPMFAKSTVNEPMCKNPPNVGCTKDSKECCTRNNPVYEYLRGKLPGKIPWNFAKFLVGRDGTVLKRWKSRTEPKDLDADIMKALAAQQAPASGKPKAGGATVKLNNGISFGVASFGLQVYGNDKAQQLTTIALEAGFRNFFASVLAGNQQGFGAAIRATHVPRSEIFVCGSVNTGDCRGMAQCKAETTKGWRDNLRDLGTAVGVLDMIMLDYPAQDCDGIKGQWAAFEAMLKSGKTKSIAVSNFSPKQLDCIVKDPKLTVPAVNQMPFSVSSDDSVLRANTQRGNIFVQAYSPLQSGRLVEDADCAAIGRAHGGKSAAQVALKYILQKGAGFTTSALTASEFREDIGLFDWTLSKAEMAKLDARASGPGH